MIVCWFSCGAASAIAAKLTIEKYGKENVRIVNNPVADEHEDNIRFLKDCEKWLDFKIETARNACYPQASIEQVFDSYGVMSFPNFAPCTLELKQLARLEWETKNGFSKQNDSIVLGYTFGEEKRVKNFKRSKRNAGYILSTPLIEEKIDKQKCFAILEQARIKLPKIYTEYGFPNANCIGCVKSGSVWYWQLVRKTFPDVFKRRCEQSRRLNCRLIDLGRKNKPRHIFLDELPNTLKGRKPKDCYTECGIFCGLQKDKDHD